MPIPVRALVLAVITSTTVAGAATRAPITVYLDRDGGTTEDGVEIPRFGGGDRVWNRVVACVRQQYAPFAVDLVEAPPTRGTYITAVVGGTASLLGLDDSTTNGVGPYSGEVIRDATVYVFSQVGTGERDVENLCATTAHEIGHVLGLDHEVLCGDIMSYYGAECGARRFVDVEAPCGEDSERDCGSGEATQSSYQRLGALVGFRDGAARRADPPVQQDSNADDAAPPQRSYRVRNRGRHHHHRGDRVWRRPAYN